MTTDFQCVTGWRVADVPWTGVKLADLLDDAGVRPSATHVRFWSFDGAYTETLTLEQARRDDVLIAHEMEGGPVTREHGGPVRLYVAPMYGYKSLKWLERIEVVERARRPHRPGLLGAPRLRRRRLGGPLQRARRRPDMTAASAQVDTRTGERVVRFARAERWLHWSNATLFLVLLATGMTLYIPALSRLVGRRVLVKDVHVYSGLLLPVPLLVAYAGRWRDAVRRDVRRFARWSVDDRRWLLEPRAPRPDAHGQVQRRPEAERHLRGRLHPGDAGHREHHAVVRPVPARLAHRGHLRARLARARASWP